MLLREIVRWSDSTLKLWQRDAIRRLIQKSELTHEDYEELFRLLKQDNAVEDAGGLEPQPISSDDLPQHNEHGHAPKLKSIFDLQHVNKIATGQRIDFSPDGITIIYGGNGCGKSGYVRVLRKACRSRAKPGDILPDATDPNYYNVTPSAKFVVTKDGVDKTISWQANEASPDELASTAVFDTNCARAYVDDEGDVAYAPAGYEVLQALAEEVFPNLERRLDQEIHELDTNVEPYSDLMDETAVGSILKNLSYKTDPERLRELAHLTEPDRQRLSDLTEALSSEDPAAHAAHIRREANRIDHELLKPALNAYRKLGPSALQEAQDIDDQLVTARDAERAARGRYFGERGLLPGTGNNAWQELFRAAERFSTQSAYPDQDFPVTNGNALCPLCQQDVSNPDAAARLQRFRHFMLEETTRVFRETAANHGRYVEYLTSLHLQLSPSPATRDQLTEFDSSLLEVIDTFNESLNTRRRYILNCLDRHTWGEPPAIEPHAIRNLWRLRQALRRQASDLRAMSDVNKRSEMESERRELSARAALVERLDPLLELVGRMKRTHALSSCHSDLRTRPVSDAAKRLVSEAVTTELSDALNEELDALGMPRLQTEIASRVDRANVKIKLRLTLPHEIPPNDVLSEGEQRAIALASFLAELRLANRDAAIVLDDPVSSLDHFYRARFAKRLASETTNRQVIVFTHDTVFLARLYQEIEELGNPSRFYNIEWFEDKAGAVREGLPWEHQRYAPRLQNLLEAARARAQGASPYPDERERQAIRILCSDLRATIERIIEDVLFGAVLSRYSDHIKVSNLRTVAQGLEPDHCTRLADTHKQVSDAVLGHDPATARNTPPPTPGEFVSLVEQIQQLVTDIKDKRKQQR